MHLIWDDRTAWRGAIAAAPVGALAAILHALLVLRLPPVDALVHYLIGAMVASGIGCLLAGILGGALNARRTGASSRRRGSGRHGPSGRPVADDRDTEDELATTVRR